MCMYTMYVRMYVHICVALLSRCVQQLKLTDLDTSQPSTVQYIVDHSRFTKLSGLMYLEVAQGKFASLCNLAVNAEEGTVFDYINSQ